MNNKKIDGFGEWLIPSGEGVIYLEGNPTEEESVLNTARINELRKNWQPSANAWNIYRQLKALTGKQVVIQLWDSFMVISEDEGALPFSCVIIRVFAKTITQEDRSFKQLFIEFKNPRTINNGNIGGDPISESCYNSKRGTYIYNCSSFCWVAADYFLKNKYISPSTLTEHKTHELLVLVGNDISRVINTISFDYNELKCFQDLLDNLFNALLATKVNLHSYGVEWILSKYDGHDFLKIDKLQGDDFRSLMSMGINKQDVFRVEIFI